MGSFSGQRRGGTGEGGTDGSSEFLPARRPLDQKLGRVVEVSHFFELESRGHVELLRNTAPKGAIEQSIFGMPKGMPRYEPDQIN